MAGTVARLHNGASNGDGNVPPLDVYKIAVDEYRFQAQFNWSRTQYLLALNVGILAAGSAVAAAPGRAAALVFVLGALTATLSTLVVRVPHSYYRAARDHMRRIEATLHLPPDQGLDTTSSMGARRRSISVNQITYLVFSALTVADLVGAALTLAR